MWEWSRDPLLPNLIGEWLWFVSGLNRLSDYVEHFEPLHYDPSPVRTDHARHKRSLPDEDHRVRLDFVAHGQRFQMELKRDHSVFHNDLSIHDNDDRPITHILDTSHIYEGKLLGKTPKVTEITL